MVLTTCGVAVDGFTAVHSIVAFFSAPPCVTILAPACQRPFGRLEQMDLAFGKIPTTRAAPIVGIILFLCAGRLQATLETSLLPQVRITANPVL